MKHSAPAPIRNQRIGGDNVGIVIKSVGDECALQTLEDPRVALECIESAVRSNDAAGKGRVKAEIGADIEDDRVLRQKATEHAYDIGFVFSTGDVSHRVEGRGIDTEIFARGELYERPIRSDWDWTTNPRPRLRVTPALA